MKGPNLLQRGAPPLRSHMLRVVILEDKHRLVEVPQAGKIWAMRGGETWGERRVGVTLADDGSCKQAAHTVCACVRRMGVRREPRTHL